MKWSLAANLRNLMEDMELTNRELAKLSNVHETTISRIRTGVSRSVRQETICNLAVALRIDDWSELLGPIPK